MATGRDERKEGLFVIADAKLIVICRHKYDLLNNI